MVFKTFSGDRVYRRPTPAITGRACSGPLGKAAPVKAGAGFRLVQERKVDRDTGSDFHTDFRHQFPLLRQREVHVHGAW